MTGENVTTQCNCLPSYGGQTVHMVGCPYHGEALTGAVLIADPEPWTEDRVVHLLDMLATISRRLESIEYNVRVR